MDLKELLPSLALHYIELKKDILYVHQAHSWMTEHNANIVKQDVDKLLKADFFKSMEEATWLSPIVIGPHKNRKLGIWIDYWMLPTAPINKMAWQTWIIMVRAISPSRQEAY